MSKALTMTVGIGLCLCTFLFTGCATVVRSPEEQVQKYSRMGELGRHMITEDLDKYMLMDRPSRLSEWHISKY